MQPAATEDVDELDIAQSRAEEVWAALTELNERMSSSPKVYRELSGRREEVEAELREALADIGAIVFEQLYEQPVGAVERGEQEAEPESDKAAEEEPRPTQVTEPAAHPSADRARIVGRVEHTLAPSGAQPGRTARITAADVASAAESMGPEFQDDSPDEGNVAVAQLLPDIKSRLGSPPEKIEKFPQFMGELGTLTSATRDEQLELWAKLPDEVQRCLAGYVTARLRHLQDEVPSAVAGAAPVKQRFSNIVAPLRDYLDRVRPGFVHGLKLDHEPKSSSWKADAQNYRAELAELARHYYGDAEGGADAAEEFNVERALYEIEAMLDGDDWERTELVSHVEVSIEHGLDASDTRLLRLLRPYRALFVASDNDRLYSLLGEEPSSEDVSDEEEEAGSVLPENWPWGPYLSRARTVMVGGDPRPEARDRIIDTFDLDVFDWVPTTNNKGVRQVQALCRRIERGTVDVVFLLTKFISHKLSNAVTDAAKGTDVHLVYLNDGYGVHHIQKAVEAGIPEEEVVA